MAKLPSPNSKENESPISPVFQKTTEKNRKFRQKPQKQPQNAKIPNIAYNFKPLQGHAFPHFLPIFCTEYFSTFLLLKGDRG